MKLTFQLMMTLSAFDTLYVVVSILLFALPQLSKGYMESGAHHYILPKALPVAQVTIKIINVKVVDVVRVTFRSI